MTTHRYESLYRLNPKLYDFAFIVQCRLKNIIFVIRHCNRILAHIDYDKATRDEFMEIIKKIGYPKNGNLAFRPCLYLYNLVRTKKPSIVLETGVSKGFSSRIILEALQRNGKGKLISTEISDNVGNLVTPHLKKRWFLVVDKNGNALSIAMKKVRTIDIFMHDSSHTHDNMLKDFTSALKKIKSNGLILSDDVESNSAFVEFAKSLNKNPIYIPNIIKCFGIINMCT